LKIRSIGPPETTVESLAGAGLSMAEVESIVLRYLSGNLAGKDNCRERTHGGTVGESPHRLTSCELMPPGPSQKARPRE
jgi:hypothetical protein